MSAHWQVVEELLSGNPHIEKESARSIADGAMMEAASVCVGQMVSAPGGTGREGWGAGVHQQIPPHAQFYIAFPVVVEGLSGRRQVCPARYANMGLAWSRARNPLQALCPQETAVLESCVTRRRSRTHSLGGATVASHTPLGSMEHGVPGALPPQLEKWDVLRPQHWSQHLSSVKTTGVGGQLRD